MRARRAWLAFAALTAADAGLADDSGVPDAEDRVPVQTIVPSYPQKAVTERREGVVQVCFHIDRDGRPYRVSVRDSTDRIFDRVAVQAVRASAYAPLSTGEKASAVKTCRTFRFSLEQEERTTTPGSVRDGLDGAGSEAGRT